jgi:GNAT superfamily N-acetyltransferase
MSNAAEKISVVKTGDELFEAWEQIGLGIPSSVEGRQQWVQAVEGRQHTFLVARVGSIAVASEFINYGGPSMREWQFREALDEKFRDHLPTPTIYALFVNPDYRGEGMGRRITAYAEHRVKTKRNVAKRVALNVETDNEFALPIYINRGYKVLPYKGHNTVILDRPTPSRKSKSKKPVYLMVKDLSR